MQTSTDGRSFVFVGFRDDRTIHGRARRSYRVGVQQPGPTAPNCGAVRIGNWTMEIEAMKTSRILPTPRRKQEATLQSAGTALLALDGWRCIVTDPSWMRGLGVTEKGICDNLYIRYGDLVLRREFRGRTAELQSRAQVLWCEWKAPTGKTEQHQRDWHAAERARGALIWVAKDPAPYGFEPTIEGFMQFYKQSGLCRKSITVGAR